MKMDFFNTITNIKGTNISRTLTPITLLIRKRIKFYLAIVAVILRAK